MHFVLLLLLLLIAADTQARYTDASYEHERRQFQQAQNLLAKRKRVQFRKVRKELAEYPLLPYLEYDEILQYLPYTKPGKIESFLKRYADTPLAPRLRNAWLKYQARHRNWHYYLRLYKPTTNTRLRCWYRRALWNTGHKQGAYAGLEQIWIAARSQPKVCDPLFKEWQLEGHLKNEWVWQRFALAMEDGQYRLARYLKRFADKDSRVWMDLWLRIHRKPAAIQDNRKLSQPHPYRSTILIHGVKRMARTDRKKARAVWNILIDNFRFTSKEKQSVERHLFLAAAHDRELLSLAPVSAYNVDADDLVAHRARLTAAIRLQRWAKLVHWINALPAQEQSSAQWRYWMARALLTTDTPEDVRLILVDLAKKPDYYGFLAADELDIPYALSAQELPADSEIILRLQSRPELIRARELFLIDRHEDMFREWRDLAASLDEEQLLALATITHKWEWLYHTIATIGKTPYRNFLEERFPTRYASKIKKIAQQTNIAPTWMFGIIRQESAFAEQARSPADARGLMQLMPATAKQIWKSIGKKARKRLDVFNVDTNLLLGASYLSRLQDRFLGNKSLATASYNAGPHRVDRWINIRCAVPPEVWIETIPFKETRDYVKRVMAYSVIYQQRLGVKRTRLRELLGGPIGDNACSDNQHIRAQNKQ